jgi:hypothetical protein
MSIRCSARRMVSSSCSTTTRVLPRALSSVQGVEQDAVVARVQADGRLVQHVADALQVRSQLRRQADALRLAARQRGRGAVQGQVAQADLLQEGQARTDLAEHVTGDVVRAALQRQRVDPAQRLVDAESGDGGDGLGSEAHRPRDRVQARAAAVRAGQVAHLQLGLVAELLLAPPRVGRPGSRPAACAARASSFSPVPTQLGHQPCLLL